MPDVRPINEKKYGISKHKFLQAYHFCMQYNEWLEELRYCDSTVKSIQITDMPKGSSQGKPDEDLAIRRAQLSRNVEMVEQTAVEADPELYPWILKAVTTEGVGYRYLDDRMKIPCSKNTYYNRRRKFYWLLSKKI